jgi:hypothetical protein
MQHEGMLRWDVSLSDGYCRSDGRACIQCQPRTLDIQALASPLKNNIGLIHDEVNSDNTFK